MSWTEALPVTNATLTEIAGDGLSEDNDFAGGPDDPRWTGSEDGYVAEELMTELDGESRNEVKVTRLIIPLEAGLQVERGDTLTYEYEGESFTRKALNVRVHDVSGEVSITFEGD